MLPPEERLPELARLIEPRQYLVLHAPRQTGKTTAVLALARAVQPQGGAAQMASFEACPASTDLGHAEGIWMHAIREEASWELPASPQPPEPGSVSLGPPVQRAAARVVRGPGDPAQPVHQQSPTPSAARRR